MQTTAAVAVCPVSLYQRCYIHEDQGLRVVKHLPVVTRILVHLGNWSSTDR